MVVVCAHRGVSAELPQNTMAAFRRAIELGVDGIELDVHLSSDGVAVVMHDETVDATTDGHGPIAEKSLSELKTLDAGAGERVPTLEEVLELAAGRIHVNIEVKASAAGREVLAVTGKFPSLRFAISSFDHAVLRDIRAVNDQVDLWPLAGMVSDDLFDTAAALGAKQLNLWNAMLNQEILQECTARGFGAWIWTVNDPDRASELVDWGAVGICTDDPVRISPAIPRTGE